MQEEFGKQISSVFSQWESDIQKSKDGEEKLEVKIIPTSYISVFILLFECGDCT